MKTYSARVSHSGGGQGGLRFFSKILPPPIKTDAPQWGAPPLKNEAPLSEKQTSLLKSEAHFYEMIPTKTTISNNLKSS